MNSYGNRAFVITDISEEEPDDKQSLVRLLLYSNEIDIEGLVACTSEWKHINNSTIREDFIDEILDRYAQVENNLRLHDARYPTADSLRSIVASGNENNMAQVGGEHDTLGSQLLAHAIMKEDSRPLWVLLWGGASTLAQALWRLRADLSKEQLTAAISRVRVYEIQGQDDAGAWIAATFPDIFFIRSQYQWRGMSPSVQGAWPEARYYQEELVDPTWFAQHIQHNHGPLGDYYPNARYIHEGDTPSFLHLIPNGLHDPDEISQGGWGGRFGSMKQANVWSGGCPVLDESAYGTFHMYTDAADILESPMNGKPTRTVYHPIIRWREAIQNDFAARMDWCTKSPKESNHAPKAILNGDNSESVLRKHLKIGDTCTFDASDSYDPNGHGITFSWWVYQEAGTHGTSLQINNCHGQKIQVSAGPNCITGEVHLILEVINTGNPPLHSYRRVVFNVYMGH